MIQVLPVLLSQPQITIKYHSFALDLMIITQWWLFMTQIQIQKFRWLPKVNQIKNRITFIYFVIKKRGRKSLAAICRIGSIYILLESYFAIIFDSHNRICNLQNHKIETPITFELFVNLLSCVGNIHEFYKVSILGNRPTRIWNLPMDASKNFADR